ncbi:MAG: class I SAM-dependent methyltransferase [Acidobacteriota bacterium]|nr:class I SAM-dependent methyltransferase [Acidobacteriota bacterium]
MPLFILLLFVFLSSDLVLGQSEHPLTGRKIAPIMGVGGAGWLERSEREKEEAPSSAIDSLGIKKGMNVADIGAGTGYFSFRLARRVGPSGRVYANDIQPEMLDRIREKAHAEGVTNVEAVLGGEADPKLPLGKMDIVIMVDVYHELSQPQEMLQRIRASLKPDGRLILLEYRKEDPAIPIRPDHKMSIPEVKTEVEAEGFKMDKVLETLPRQHIFFFKKLSM